MRTTSKVWMLAAALGLAACGESDLARVPDFQLLDVNPNSSTFGESVSPRAHLGHVTAWYFGSAT